MTSCSGPTGRRWHPRNLIVLRAGDASLHPQWIAAKGRDFDLFVSYYGATPGRHGADADYYEMRPGPRWPCIADLVEEHRPLLDDDDCVWFPDDDLAADTVTLERMFAYFRAYRLNLAQPVLTRDSYYTWDNLLQAPKAQLRFCRFVEVMAPLFSRAALAACVPSFRESPSG